MQLFIKYLVMKPFEHLQNAARFAKQIEKALDDMKNLLVQKKKIYQKNGSA